MPRVEQVQQKALEEFRERNRNAAKRKKQQGTRQLGESAVTFVCLFFLLSLLFLQVAKHLTPKIDTSVGNNTEVAETPEPKSTIDDRLKLIQFNDAMASGELQKQKEREIFNEALDEKVVLPRNKKSQTEENSDLNEKVQDIISRNLTEVKTLDKEQTPAQPKAAPTAPAAAQPETPAVSQAQSKEELDKRISAIKAADINIPATANYKVLVGKYQTAEQAQLAKSIIRETVNLFNSPTITFTQSKSVHTQRQNKPPLLRTNLQQEVFLQEFTTKNRQHNQEKVKQSSSG